VARGREAGDERRQNRAAEAGYQKARTITGCFRATKLGALMVESIDQRLPNRRTGRDDLRCGCSTSHRAVRLKKWQGHHQAGKKARRSIRARGESRGNSTAPHARKVGVDLVMEGWREAGEEAERGRAGLTIFTNGSQIDNKASGYSVSLGERRGVGDHQDAHGL